MKYNIIFTLLILSSCFLKAQPIIAFKEAEKDLNWAFEHESDPFNRRSSYTSTGASVTNGGTIWNTQIAILGGMAARIYVTVSTSGPCQLTATGGLTATTSTGDRTANVNESYIFPKGGGQRTIGPINMLEFSAVILNFASRGTRDTVDISYSATGVQLFTDMQFNSKLKWLEFTDSQGFSGLGAQPGSSLGNLGSTVYSRRVIDSLRKLGVDIGLWQKGVSGITTAQYMQLILSGKFDNEISKASIIGIALGTNDASAGGPSSQNFAINYRSILNHIIAHNKKALLIFYSPPGTSVNAIANNISAYRTAIAGFALQYQALYPTREIKHFNKFTFVPDPVSPTDVNYTETGTGNQLHQTGHAGHASIASGLLPMILSTTWYQNIPKTLK